MSQVELIALILAFGGIGVVGFTEMIKRAFGASGVWAYIISFIVSAAATAITLVTRDLFSWVAFIALTVLVFCEANGIYKVAAKSKVT